MNQKFTLILTSLYEESHVHIVFSNSPKDFVRFPWQNQPAQSSTTAAASPPASSSGSVSSGLSRAYGSTSGQLNPGFYATVTQPLDLISEEMDPSPAQLLR